LDLAARIRGHRARVTGIGQRYVRLPLAADFAGAPYTCKRSLPIAVAGKSFITHDIGWLRKDRTELPGAKCQMNRSVDQMNRSVEWWRPDVAVDRDDLSNAPSTATPQVSGSAVPFWFLMVFTFILLLAPQQWLPALLPFRVALLAAAVAVIAHVYDRLSRGQPIVHLTREMWITLCLLGWAVLSVPFSYWPSGSLSFLAGFYLKTLAIFWLLSNVVNTSTRLRQVAWGLSLMAVPLAFTGVAHFISGVFIPEGTTVGTKRIVGYDAPLTMNPNDLALMLNLILPLCAALLLSTPRPLVRALLLAMIGLDVTAVILTFSRAGFLTLAMIAIIYLWKIRKRPGRGWVWAALVVALACLPLLRIASGGYM